MSNVDARADDPYRDAGGPRGKAGGYDPAHSNATSSPGGDMGSQVGGDDGYDNQISEPPEPDQGIATRAAQEADEVQEGDGPAHVGGTGTTTPGYTP
ncbi:MAG: hypothetical protein M3P51_11010 [Chloroflexota bacterium]|nr:hypothetical protein [Chloroflexota bacterium]